MINLKQLFGYSKKPEPTDKTGKYVYEILNMLYRRQIEYHVLSLIVGRTLCPKAELSITKDLAYLEYGKQSNHLFAIANNNNVNLVKIANSTDSICNILTEIYEWFSVDCSVKHRFIDKPLTNIQLIRGVQDRLQNHDKYINWLINHQAFADIVGSKRKLKIAINININNIELTISQRLNNNTVNSMKFVLSEYGNFEPTEPGSFPDNYDIILFANKWGHTKFLFENHKYMRE